METPSETRYLILGADAKEYGPVTAAQIRQWIDEGRANAASRARVERETEWRKLEEFPEFAETLAVRPTAFVPGANYESAATPLPDDLLKRDYDLNLGSCLSRGFDLLREQFGLVFGGSAVFLGIQLLVTILSMIPLVGSVVSLASFVIYGPLMGGLYLLIIRALRNQPAQVSDVFSGFHRNTIQLILGYIVMLILTVLAAAPAGVLVLIGVIPQAMSNELQPLWMLAVVFGALICLAAVLFVTVCWMFTLPLIIDRQMDFWPAMETSRKVVMKHWWKCLLLYLLVAVLNMIGVMLCCLGLFFTMPLTCAAMMFAYEDVFCRPSVQRA